MSENTDSGLEELGGLDPNYNKILVSGSVKAAMKEHGAGSSDLWKVPVDAIKVLEGFNVRVKDASYHAHVREIADSIKANGFYVDEPLGGYCANEDGQQVIYAHAGHVRLEAARLAISEGALIERLPMIMAPAGTSLEDLVVALVQTNAGHPLTPYETAIVCKRLKGYGWDNAQISTRLSFTTQYVEGLLEIMGAPLVVRQMIQDGRVAFAVALDALRKHGSGAVAHLQTAETIAKAAGKTKVTAKFLPGARFDKAIKRSGPRLFEVATQIRSDPAFKQLGSEIRQSLLELIDELEALRATTEATTEQAALPLGDGQAAVGA